MDFSDAIHISSSGLSAQRLRMNLISNNMANVYTTRTEAGGPYQRQDAVFSAVPLETSFDSIMQSQLKQQFSEVQVTEVVSDPRPPIVKYDPNHPDADEKGYVSLPNINLVEEMTNMMSAARSYEANVAAINLSKKMALKAMEIGR